jgi:hypothetical protein
MSREFFDECADALIGFLPPELSAFSHRATSRNLKVWYGNESREHYEIQVAGGRLEIGFHTEHPNPDRNDAVLDGLLADERAWRRALGRDVEAGAYLGRQSATWRRVSEVWDEDADDPAAAIEAADRLAAYITAIEPVRRGTTRRGARRARR